ncbi:MAG: glycosyltransferase family 9 protein [Cyclobacteriaceae bacterium]
MSRYWFYIKLFLRRFFNLASFAYYYAIDTVVLFAPTQKLHEGTGIIKLDAIGDHILYRNLFQYLPTDGKKPFLIIPPNLKDIYTNLDQVDELKLITLNPAKFNTNISYRLKKLYQIRKLCLKTIIVATNSKTTMLEDAMIRCSAAPRKIGAKDAGNNMPALLISLTSKWYSQIIKTSPDITFEHLRNVDFLSQLTKVKISPMLEINLNTEQKELFVIFPGAGRPYRMWSPENFKQVAKYLIAKNNMYGVVLGTKTDFELGEVIKSCAPDKVTNLCGQISLFESIKTTSSSRMIVCNESGPAHIGAALGVQTVCISNGNHYGRFHPYPESLNKPIIHLYPPMLNKELSEKGVEFVINKYKLISTLNINTVTPEHVISSIEKLF